MSGVFKVREGKLDLPDGEKRASSNDTLIGVDSGAHQRLLGLLDDPGQVVARRARDEHLDTVDLEVEPQFAGAGLPRLVKQAAQVNEAQRSNLPPVPNLVLQLAGESQDAENAVGSLVQVSVASGGAVGKEGRQVVEVALQNGKQVGKVLELCLGGTVGVAGGREGLGGAGKEHLVHGGKGVQSRHAVVHDAQHVEDDAEHEHPCRHGGRRVRHCGCGGMSLQVWGLCFCFRLLMERKREWVGGRCSGQGRPHIKRLRRCVTYCSSNRVCTLSGMRAGWLAASLSRGGLGTHFQETSSH